MIRVLLWVALWGVVIKALADNKNKEDDENDEKK